MMKSIIDKITGDSNHSRRKTGFLMKHFFQIFLPVLVLMIFSFFIIFMIVIPLLEKKYLQNKHDMCRTLVELAISDLYSRQIEVTNGSVSLEEAQERAITRFRYYRFGDDGRDYFWFQGPDSIMIMHPYRPDLEGRKPDNIPGPDGRMISELYRELYKTAEQPGGGFVEYKWYWKENLDVIKDKVSYVKIFEPWGWLIGTGVYIDDIEKEIDEWIKTFGLIGLFLLFTVSVFTFFLSIRAAHSRQREIDALDQLSENEIKFRSVFTNSPYSIAINSLDKGEYISVNMEFQSFTGITDSELAGKTWFDYNLSPDNIGSDIKGNLKNYGKVYNYESEIHTSSGESKSIMYTAALIEMKGKEAVISIMVDLTDRKKLEDALRQSQKMDVIGQLTGGIAHDFNNMLAGIMGSAEILKLKVKDNPDLRKHVDFVLKSSDRAADLIKKLLAFARRGIEVSTTIDVHDIIRESVVILERSIDRKIKISIKFNALSSFVNGDPVLLQNVILNLGLNARDAMPYGGEITISTDNIIVDEEFADKREYEINPGKYVAIYVEDTGAGMNSDLLNRVFEPFFTTKPEGKGTGLGLSVVYGTIKEHHGFIDVYSEPGEGTIIKMYIPAAEAGPSGILKSENEPVRGKGSVLVVDDEDIVRTIAGSLLESLGYECLFAENGLEAIDIYRREMDRIDAVLLDIIMPGISGVETYQKLKEIDEKVKVVFSSGFRRDERVADIIKKGKKRFIQKPYHLMELSRMIHDAIYED